MARRILSIDWDGVETRFAFGFVQKDRLIVLKAGAAPIVDAAETIAEAATSENETDSDAENAAIANADENEKNASDDENAAVETVGSPTIPAYDFDEDDAETPEDPRVVSTVKKPKKGESFKTSPLAKTLKKLLREQRVGSATVVYSVERGDVDVLITTIPQASDAETPELVFNQALRDSLTFSETQPLDYLPIGATSTKRSGTRQVVAVSMTREKLRRVRETLIGAVRAPSKIGLREPALAEFLRVGFCGLTFAEPVVLVQELCDEVNLTLCAGTDILYFRSFKIAVEADADARAERIREEIVRTIAVGTDDLPEDAVVSKALYFTGETKTPPTDQTDSVQDSEKPSQPITESNVSTVESETPKSAPGVGILLTRLLENEGIALEFANPFRLPGVKMKSDEPENPGRFASLLGTLLAERPQNVSAIDLLHPRQKPKAPNYGLYILAYFFVVGIAFAGAYFWNKGDLKRIQGEIVALEKSRDAVGAEMNSKRPLYNVLSQANAWQNSQGIVVLDELRDIMLRIPKAPDLVVTRLSYLQNWQGRPMFAISAKITSIEVYQQFRAALISGNAHMVTSQRGPVANVGGGGYRYLFDANIICSRRQPASYNARLPQELQAISANSPERFVEIERERQAELKRLQEEAQKQREETARQTQAIRQRLTQGSQPLNAQLKQAQEAKQKGEIDEAKFNEIQTEFQRNVKPLADLWNELTNYDSYMKTREAAFQRGEINQTQWNQLLTEYGKRVAQIAQKCDQIFAPSAPQPEASAPEQPAPAPQPEAPAPEQPAPAPQPEAPAPEQPAPAPQPEAPAPEQPAPAPQPEAPAPEQPAPAPQPEAPAPEQPAPAPQPEAPAPEQPAPAPQPEAPAPEQPAPASQPEAPAPEQPAPALQPEAPAPEQPVPAPSASLDRSQTVETEV